MTTTTWTHEIKLVEGASAPCAYCGKTIFLDVTEGGGDPDSFYAWDWGSAFHDGIGGYDYGCGDAPDTDQDGTGGHCPVWGEIDNRDCR